MTQTHDPQVVAPRSLAELAPIDPADIQHLETLAREVSLQPADLQSSFGTAFSIAERLFRLREAITPAMGGRIMALQGLPMGFRTDRDRYKDRATGKYVKGPGYPWPIVRDCLIEAVLRGVYPWGNMFNILGEAPYITRSGFQFKLTQLPTFSHLKKNPQPPRQAGELVLVTYAGTFTYNGAEDHFERTYSLDFYKTDKAALLLGKAERKWLRDLWDYLTMLPVDLPDGEVEEGEMRRLPAAPDAALPLAEALPEVNVVRADPVTLPFGARQRAAPAQRAAPPPAPPATPPAVPAAQASPPRPAPAAPAPASTWGDGTPIPEPTGPDDGAWRAAAPAASPAPAEGPAPIISREKLDKLRKLGEQQGVPEKEIVAVLSAAREACGVQSVYDLPASAETEILRGLQQASRRRRRATG